MAQTPPYAGAGGRGWPSTADFIPNLNNQGEIKGTLETELLQAARNSSKSALSWIHTFREI